MRAPLMLMMSLTSDQRARLWRQSQCVFSSLFCHDGCGVGRAH